jgi:hypothetical protein
LDTGKISLLFDENTVVSDYYTLSILNSRNTNTNIWPDSENIEINIDNIDLSYDL